MNLKLFCGHFLWWCFANSAKLKLLPKDKCFTVKKTWKLVVVSDWRGSLLIKSSDFIECMGLLSHEDYLFCVRSSQHMDFWCWGAYTNVVFYQKNVSNNGKLMMIRHCFYAICLLRQSIFEPRHEISNNVVCATSKGSDQPAHMRSLIRAFASCFNILWILSY